MLPNQQQKPDASAQKAPTGPKAPPTPAPTGGKTKGIVGQTEGVDAQAALLAPDKQPLAPPSGPAPVAPVAPGPQAAPDAKADAAKDKPAPTQGGDAKTDLEQKGIAPEAANAGENLSPIRQELLKQFELLEGKGVGMKEFDAICSQGEWEKAKEKERVAKEAAETKYKADMEAYMKLDEATRKRTPKPVKQYVPVYTTCIDTMRVIAQTAWKASGMAVKRIDGQKFDQFSFGSESRTKASKIGAWEEASPKCGKSPKTGDMIMLEKAGPKIDKLAEEGRGLDLNAKAKEDKLKKEIANLEAASASTISAISTAAKAKAPQVQAALEKARADYEAAKAAMKVKLAEAQAGLADKVKGGTKLEFSHVGFFKSKTDELGPDGQPTGREVWLTFDGGQSQIAGAIGGQGAKAGKRYYDPATNMITGEASQGGAMRWLGGWVDVDKMAKGSDPKPA